MNQFIINIIIVKGLFHRAIMESGVSLSSWAFSRRGPEMAKIVAKDLGIESNNIESMIKQMKKVDPELLQIKAAAAAAFVSINSARCSRII